MTGRGRGWWLAAASGAAVGGAVVWAVLRFGLLAWLGDDKESKVRPVVEGLSWIAGIGGLAIGVVALVVALRQGRVSTTDVPAVAGPVASQAASDRRVIINGGVSGGSGPGPTVGVNFGYVGDLPPDPPQPART